MDGGVDGFVNLLMTSYEGDLGYFHNRVQKIINERYCGEQPVGSCLLVHTNHPKIKYVAHTPTMKVPEDVGNTLNAYLAFRALLVEILWHNKHITHEKQRILTMSCTPFCTSAGSMSYSKCAKQMRAAYDSVFITMPQVEDWPSLHQSHRELLKL
jgi:O-acetyl-ADP-ribose deacetylase (regulator of RNase III)